MKTIKYKIFDFFIKKSTTFLKNIKNPEKPLRNNVKYIRNKN